MFLRKLVALQQPWMLNVFGFGWNRSPHKRIQKILFEVGREGS